MNFAQSFLKDLLSPCTSAVARRGFLRASSVGGIALALALAVVAPAGAQSVVAVSNLTEVEAGSQAVSQLHSPVLSSVSLAQTFTTGGSAFYLDSITLQMADASLGYGFTVTLHETEWDGELFVPGLLLTQLQGSSTPDEPGAYDYSTTEQIILSANSTYFWMAWIQPDGLEVDTQFNVATTSSPVELSDEGWSAGDAAMIYEGTETSGEWSEIGNAVLFSVNATVVPEPGACAAIAGLAALGGAFLRRRRR